MKTARLAVSLVLALAASGASADNHGRYFPKAVDYGNGFYDFTWDSASDKVAKSDFEYKTDKGTFGNIRFDSDGFKMKRDVGENKGLISVGYAAAGGFWLDDKSWSLPEGYSVRFAQIVKTNIPGPTSPWKEGDLKNWFPDVNEETGTGSPLYPNVKLNVDPEPTVGFEDYPNGFYLQGNSEKRFELGLFATKDTTAVLLGSLKWGFDITAELGKNEGTMKGIAPVWGAPTDDLLKTLSAFYDGAKLDKNDKKTTKWTFTYDSKGDIFTSVPSPGTALLIGLGALVAAGRRRKAA